jgi:hypothetical protein
MKKLMIAVTSGPLATVSFARQEPPQPPPVEKRWEMDSKKISEAVELKPEQLQKMKAVFYSFYKDMDALHESSKQQRPPKEAVEKNINTRNESIKKILTTPQNETFVKVSKELGPRRRPEGDRPPMK